MKLVIIRQINIISNYTYAYNIILVIVFFPKNRKGTKPICYLLICNYIVYCILHIDVFENVIKLEKFGYRYVFIRTYMVHNLTQLT